MYHRLSILLLTFILLAGCKPEQTCPLTQLTPGQHSILLGYGVFYKVDKTDFSQSKQKGQCLDSTLHIHFINPKQFRVDTIDPVRFIDPIIESLVLQDSTFALQYKQIQISFTSIRSKYFGLSKNSHTVSSTYDAPSLFKILRYGKINFYTLNEYIGQLFISGNYTDIIIFCDQQLKDVPDDPNLTFYKAIAFYKLNDFKRAHLLLDRVCQLDTANQLDAPYNIGVLYYEEKEYTKALNKLNTVLHGSPNRLDANYYKALSLYYLNRKDEAKPLFESLAKAGVQDATMYLNLFY